MEAKNDLHALRLAVMTTQATMAEHMGVPLRTYEDLENGKSTIRPIHINAARWACISIQASGLTARWGLTPEIERTLTAAGYVPDNR